MSNRSGMAVIEVGIPTGYIIVNDVLRSYVQSAEVPTLSRAEFYEQKAVFYLDYVSSGFLFVADVEDLYTHLTYSGMPFFVLFPDFRIFDQSCVNLKKNLFHFLNQYSNIL